MLESQRVKELGEDSFIHVGFFAPSCLCWEQRSLIEKLNVGIYSSILDSEIYVQRVEKSFDIIRGI